ncbi:P-loop NTPase [Sphingomonas montana]|uniref:P-loop NTPase n=1 Tax=Sphingomonas montana TaxID=1843236 RepID=UPI00096F03D3|nr:P-loop NTPase [Sphingomonas montana]
MTEPRRSLFERAAEVYDFGAAARARAPGPVVDARPPLDRERIEAAFAGPAAPNRRGSVNQGALAAAGFVTLDGGVTAIAEEFRLVKRQLLQAATAPDASPRDRMLLVASALPAEGKTFCAVNLALSIAAEKDFEVLLVDADVAKPSIPALLGLEDGPGLMDAIADPRLDVEGCIIRTDVGNLSVLPAGRAGNDATELLASDRTRTVLDRIAAQRSNRIVLFDSPPALAASPASELAHHVGRVMLVVRADRTGETELHEAVALLSGCADIRLLLNATAMSSGGRRFGSYYGQGD